MRSGAGAPSWDRVELVSLPCTLIGLFLTRAYGLRTASRLKTDAFVALFMHTVSEAMGGKNDQASNTTEFCVVFRLPNDFLVSNSVQSMASTGRSFERAASNPNTRMQKHRAPPPLWDQSRTSPRPPAGLPLGNPPHDGPCRSRASKTKQVTPSGGVRSHMAPMPISVPDSDMQATPERFAMT